LTEIRAIQGLDELRAVEALQRDVWNVADLEIVPALHFIPAIAVGAILIGAFDGDRMIGFVYGFPGFEDGMMIIHSDMLAVHPDYRGQGLGRRLKLAQRDAALAAGIQRITWTFDPLQTRNAHLNFTLGVVGVRYLRDFYGQTTSPLHRDGTDRLWVHWNLKGGARATPAALFIAIPPDPTLARSVTRREFESAFARGLIVTGFDREQNRYVLS
jgi:predicted GNAT superfamily acetyltransferase